MGIHKANPGWESATYYRSYHQVKNPMIKPIEEHDIRLGNEAQVPKCYGHWSQEGSPITNHI
jgi:hypothetical protein